MALFLYTFALEFLLILGGCAPLFTAQTTVHFELRPDGTCVGDYTSNKDQVGLSATLCGGSQIHVDKATTSEAVTAAVLQLHLRISDLLEKLNSRQPPPGALGK